MELRDAISCALDNLGELDRKVIELRYGLSGHPREAQETADLLGISVNDVWTCEAYGLETLSFVLLTSNDVKPRLRRVA